LNLTKLDDQQKLELIAYRRLLHQFPELGFQEVKTSGFIAEKLENFGVETHKGIAKTGVVGLIQGKRKQERGNRRKRSTIMLRVDMDALPIQEQNRLDYSSKNQGVMHA
jgi:hippurate hydrolase